jgi:lipopolysaccharide transport system permease protein
MGLAAGAQMAAAPSKAPQGSRAPVPSNRVLEPKPLLVIRPTSGWAALNLKEIWPYRDLLWTLASRDIKVRYKQTSLGVIWVVLQPLLAAGIFSFVFGKIANLPSDGLPYILFSYSGLQAWTLFATILNRTSGCLVGNDHLITKVYFPRLILPLSSLPSALLDFIIAMGMMAVLLIAFRVAPRWELLFLPVWMLILMVLATGTGLWLAALMVAYRDVRHMLPVGTQMLLYASPVAYAVSVVPEDYRTLYYLNPLSAPLDAFRWSLLRSGYPPWWALVWSASLGALALVLGAIMFKRMERTFADIV